jgi:anti-sigma factor RsiW
MVEMRECKHDEEMTALMSLALDGLLEGDDRRHLDQHLATCSACQREWKVLQQVGALFEQSPMIGPPLGFAVRVDRRLAESTKRRRRLFGGVAVLTSSLSLAGVTVAAVLLIVGGILAWQWLGSLPSVQQGTTAVSHVASSMGLVGKGASFFLKDLLLRYGPPLVLLLGVGLAVLAGVWAWLFVKRPGNSRRNGYV